jgi:hypothetical protein
MGPLCLVLRTEPTLSPRTTRGRGKRPARQSVATVRVRLGVERTQKLLDFIIFLMDARIQRKCGDMQVIRKLWRLRGIIWRVPVKTEDERPET